MALDFPTSPTNGQIYGNFIWSTAKGAWQAKPITGKVTTSATAPSAPSNGDEWFNTNDGNLYVYYTDVDGSQWVQVKSDATLSSTLGTRVEALEAKPSGLVQLVPGSATVSSGTATVSASGTVEFSSGTTISVNNVFSSAYSSYRIVLTYSGSTLGGAMYLRIRSAGTDRTNPNHYYGGRGLREAGGDIQIYGNGATSFDISRSIVNNPYGSASTIDIHNVFDSGSGTSVNYASWANDGSGGFGFTASGIYSLLNSNDGFSFFITSGTFATGRIKIYGYR